MNTLKMKKNIKQKDLLCLKVRKTHTAKISPPLSIVFRFSAILLKYKWHSLLNWRNNTETYLESYKKKALEQFNNNKKHEVP